jgi:hypothetical protein
MRLVIVLNRPQAMAIWIEMQDAKGERQTKFAVKMGWMYTVTHDPPRRERKQVARTPAIRWGLTVKNRRHMWSQA